MSKATMNSSGNSSRISSNQEIEKNLDMVRIRLEKVSDKLRPILKQFPHLMAIISKYRIWSKFGFSIRCSNLMKFSLNYLNWTVTSMTYLKTILNDFNEGLRTFIEHLEDSEEIIEAKNVHFRWIERLLKYQVGNEKTLANNMKQFYNNVNSFVAFLDTIESIISQRNASSLPRYDINHGDDNEGQDMEDVEEDENAIQVSDNEHAIQNQNGLDENISYEHMEIVKKMKRISRKRENIPLEFHINFWNNSIDI